MLMNPVILAVAMVSMVSLVSCLVGVWVVRSLRRRFTEEAFLAETTPALNEFPMHTYNAVIQQLKQQKHELLSVQQAERRRAKTSENLSAAVLSNLSSGVLFLGTNGLVRKANSAARSILGYASPAGMSVEEVFRDSTLVSDAPSPGRLTTEIRISLRELTPSRNIQARYETPAGEHRLLEVTTSSVRNPAGELLGAACLINDKTEMATLQREQAVRGEMSAEMALALRNSAASIASYARQVAVSNDPRTTQQLAADIVSEAAELDHTIGGFLSSGRAAKAAGA